MGSEESANLEERLKSFLLHLHTESGILERIVYKNKNQHRRCPYFQALLKVRRDLRLLQSAGLGEILDALFPIIDGKKHAQKAYLPKRQKKNNLSGKHNYRERLLGVARLLSQMAEPILKAATQISFLLAKSFFTGFSLTILALLARLRVLVQQMLLDVVSVFNKVSSLSQKQHSIKLTPEGIEAFREYYPLSGDVLMLECVWKEDKFVLLERTHNSNIKNQDEGQGALPLETSIQYETIQLFSEVQSTEREQSSEKIPEYSPANENCPLDMQPAMNSPAEPQSATISDSTNAVECQKFPSEELPFEGNLFASGDLVPSPKSPEPQTESRKNVAFISVGKSKLSETNDTSGPSKKMKLDLLSSNAVKTDNPFLHPLIGGSMNRTFCFDP